MVDDPDTVADALGLLHVVRRVHHGKAFAPEGLHPFQDGVAALGIDADGRLVQHEQLRVVEQSGRDVHAPFHAAGERVEAVVAPVGQLGQLEGLVDPGCHGTAPELVQPGKELEILPGGEVGVEGHILGHVADERLDIEIADRLLAGDGDGPLVGLEQAAHHLHGRRLAGAVRPEQAVDLALEDAEADAVDGEARAEALGEPGTVEDGCPARGRSTCPRRAAGARGERHAG